MKTKNSKDNKGFPKLSRGRQFSNADDFIEKANKIHGDEYDYSKSRYERATKKINIICNIHGVFPQTPRNHLRGQGCPKCGYVKRWETIKGSRKFNKSDNSMESLFRHALESGFLRHAASCPMNAFYGKEECDCGYPLFLEKLEPFLPELTKQREEHEKVVVALNNAYRKRKNNVSRI